MKIAIIGYSGSGKSTLAGFLGKQLNLPVLYFDTVHWLPGWEERSDAEKNAIVGKFMDENDSWVMDGNYTKTLYERRLVEADRIIFMDFGRAACFFRALRRYFLYKGKTRDSMTKGCSEKFDFEFMCWLLIKGRSKKHRERYRRVLEQYGEKVIVIRNQKELNEFKRRIHKRHE